MPFCRRTTGRSIAGIASRSGMPQAQRATHMITARSITTSGSTTTTPRKRPTMTMVCENGSFNAIYIL